MAGVLIPAPFPPTKKGYNFVPQRKVIDYYAAAVKTLEVRMILCTSNAKNILPPFC